MYKLNKIRGFVALPIIIASAVLAVGVLGGLAVFASPPLPTPICRIEGVIKSVEFKDAYNDPCLKEGASQLTFCPTDTELYHPARYFFDISVSSVGYVSGEMSSLTCENMYPIGKIKNIFIDKDKVKTGNIFSINQKIAGAVRSFWGASFDSYSLVPAKSFIKILSPNGGEVWLKGTVQAIKWSDIISTTCSDSLTGGSCTSATPKYDIELIPYSTPCPEGMGCAPQLNYTIAKNIQGYSYDWLVGKYLERFVGGAGGIAPDGSYKIRICQTGSTACDSSDNYFTISAPISGCAKEGQSYSGVFTDKYPSVCCDGLIGFMSGMDTRKVVDGKCIATGMESGYPVGICIKCGDGVCGTGESVCSCPKDCEKIAICDATSKAIVDSVGGCSVIDQTKYSNIYKACCVKVTKETLLSMLNTALADGVIDASEKTALLTALNSYLQ